MRYHDFILHARIWTLHEASSIFIGLCVVAVLVKSLTLITNEPLLTMVNSALTTAMLTCGSLLALSMTKGENQVEVSRSTILHFALIVCGAGPAFDLMQCYSALHPKYPFAMVVAFGTHFCNLLAVAGTLASWAIGRSSEWTSIRACLVCLGCTTLLASALTHHAGSTLHVAPGGTSSNLYISLFCAIVTLLLAAISGPSMRRRILDMWIAQPLSSSALSLSEQWDILDPGAAPSILDAAAPTTHCQPTESRPAHSSRASWCTESVS